MSKLKQSKDPYAEREAQKYENPIPSREFILQYLADRGRPANQMQIEKELGLRSADEREALRRRLIAMTRDGQLLKNRKGAYGPLESMEVVAGRVIGHKDGFGFIVPDKGGDDLFLTPRQMRSIFHGDRVLARVSTVDSRGRPEAMIVEVLEQNTQQIVGRLFLESGTAFVEPSNQRINQDILIPREDLNGAKDGQMVVAGITTQPSARSRPIGKIVEVLGDHMAPGMEVNVAIRSHNLPFIWPEDALLEAGRYPAEVTESAIAGRNDLRDLPFVTIDGEDAKDFDDAVYCVPRGKNGGFTLYVAIADVSYYVRPGMALDKEAEERGNSVYFPGRVIPMLPEALSNNLCSLVPEKDRLVMVCEMTIQPTGRISKFDFSEAVIHSHARLTYSQVHAMIEKNDRRMQARFKDVVPHLKNLYDLFHTLISARKKRGAIDFDMPETKIVFGRDRKIEKIIPYERFDSHRVIEECMLAANISSARFLEKHKQPALYRVHEGPTVEKLNDLRRFVQEMGLKMPKHRDPVPNDYASLLESVANRPDAHMIQTVLLRSMSQAIYSPDNKGHFGLAYDAYTHFTSPIRRYPDLLVHRGIKHILQSKKPQQDDGSLARFGEHCSMTERRADEATRDASDWLKCEFMLDKVGKEFKGVISGVTGFGIFVELADIYVEGLVHITALPEDYYQFDAIHHCLRGERTGKQFRLGDSVTIQVARVDLDKRQIDFIIAGTKPRSADGARPNRHAKGGESGKSKRHGKGGNGGRSNRHADKDANKGSASDAPKAKKKEAPRQEITQAHSSGGGGS